MDTKGPLLFYLEHILVVSTLENKTFRQNGEGIWDRMRPSSLAIVSVALSLFTLQTHP